MMKKTKTMMLMAGVAVAALAGVVWADQKAVNVDAQFRIALALAKNSDIDFTPGATYLEFTGTPGSSDFVTLGTNGNIGTAGTAFNATGTGTVGDITINADGTSDVDITCTAGATIADTSGADTIGVTQIQISMDTGHNFGSADYDCTTLVGTPYQFTLTGANHILVGGRVGDAALTGGYLSTLYNTTHTNGVPAQVKVIYH